MLTNFAAVLSTLLFTLLHTHAQLVIKACCGGDNGGCNTYETIDELFGIACCALTPYNTYSQLCCNGFVRERYRSGSFADRCCGNEVLRNDQTCCNGTVHNVVNGDCCGNAVYSASDSAYICCDGNLARTSSSTDVCCGKVAFDGGRQQICCGNKVSDRDQADACCTLNNGTVVEYLSRSQFCCNGAVPRGGGQACCYMRIDSELVAEPYNTDTQCCRYPYDIIYPKLNGSCTNT
ncbi:hypothetical protein Q1695_010514 [Nippostrongylus brasiliensis]|nr:hypothetical protein Q1695_010514 [Nippostrongylus brasiliensis]